MRINFKESDDEEQKKIHCKIDRPYYSATVP